MGIRARRRSIAHKKTTTNPSAYNSLVIEDGAIGYWPLGSGSTDNDLSGNNRHLSWTGTQPTSQQILGSIVGGVNLNGTSLSRHPSATVDAVWNSGQSIEAWVKFTSGSDMAIMSLRNTNEHYALYHNSTNNLVLAVAYNSGMLVQTANTSTPLNDGSLHHVLATWNSSAYDIYIDGVNVASGTFGSVYSPSSSSTYLTVGSEIGPVRQWNGQIGHVAIYPTKLSVAQAIAHNNLGRGVAPPPPTPANAAAVWWADDISQADGSSVATWTDRVNGIAVTQSTSGSRPALDADGLNGKASVNFDGVDDWLGVNSAISTSNTGCVVAVFRTLGSTNAETVWCASSTSASQQYLIARTGHTTVDQIGIQSHHGTSQDCVWQIDESSFGTPNNRVVEWGSNGSSWSMRLENNTKTLIKRSGDSSPDTGYWMNDIASHNAFTIGAERFISGPLYTLGQYNMRLAYLGVFDSPLSTQDRYDLYKWIETYYGITGMPGLS